MKFECLLVNILIACSAGEGEGQDEHISSPEAQPQRPQPAVILLTCGVPLPETEVDDAPVHGHAGAEVVEHAWWVCL